MKLSDAMIKALAHLARDMHHAYPHRFETLEALRRRGLAERYTMYVTRTWFADKDGERKQDIPGGRQHEWWITTAGRRALEDSGNETE